MASKFVEHFLWIAASMDRVGEHQDKRRTASSSHRKRA
jgi:hypothetical protein